MSKLLERTLNLTKRAKIANLSDEKIASGAGVKTRWLSYFIDGKYSDPGVIKIEKLNTYLSSIEHELPQLNEVKADTSRV